MFLVNQYIYSVKNGGHSQYFYNEGNLHVKETIKALEAMELPELAGILHDVWKSSKNTSEPELKPYDVSGYIDYADSEDFSKADNQLFSLAPDPVDIAIDNYAEQINQLVGYYDPEALELHGFETDGIKGWRLDQLLPIAHLDEDDLESLEKLIIDETSKEGRKLPDVVDAAYDRWDKKFQLSWRFTHFRVNQLIESGVLESETREVVLESGVYDISYVRLVE